MTETAAERNYKKTLNLPRTGFPMRANLSQNEAASSRRWDEIGLYHRVLELRRDAEPFVFHDGPPFANARLHAGHLLNKVLKDIVVRSRLMAGRRCAFVPGWDCHGLPIEHKVLTEIQNAGKMDKLHALDDDAMRMAIRRECQKSAAKFQKVHTQQLHAMLTLADYEAPYLTMQPGYERAVLGVFASLLEQGLVYRALRPVHWSIANETALAEAELEYEDREDLSVYVDFEFTDRDAVAAIFGVELDLTPSLMIWTTTPWTLPANLAVAVHEAFDYALVQVDGNVTVIASELVGRVTGAGGATDVEVLGEAGGASLVGLTYRQPLSGRVCPIVAAEYVTLEDGTGLVHTAPGHGAEDYATGIKEGIEIYCPVRDDGTYDDTVPQWLRGMSVWDANTAITEHLRNSGHLFHDETFVHSYPHDWRSKTPVIFRSTEQWFVGVDRPTAREGTSLRELAMAESESAITFHPAWGRNRFRGMIESRPDWCLSRQRAWGLPIPAFRMPDGAIFLTATSVRAVGEIFGARGSDAWFTETPAQLLAGYDAAGDPDAPSGLDVAKLAKMHDIFDVWMESGSSWHAVMRERDLGFPIDLYLEGSDQHRGWFQLSLLPALGMTGHTPFRNVLTHGFVVDKDGRKMSKSGGNAIDVDDVLAHHGADVARWWVSSLAYENDVKADESFFDVAGESYRKVRNTLRFLLSNLSDFAPDRDAVDGPALAPASVDAYILAEAGKLQADVCAAYERYEFRRAHQRLYDFCNETLSAFYCAAVKDRLYCDRIDSPRRRATQTVMWHLVESLTRLLAPVLSHTADEAYRALWSGIDDEQTHKGRCVHLETHLEAPAVTADPAWPEVLAARDRALKALEAAKPRGIENPLDAELVVPDPKGVLTRFAADFPDLCGVSRVTFTEDGDAVTVNDLSGEPRCERSWKRDGTVKQRSDGGMLSDRDAEAVGV